MNLDSGPPEQPKFFLFLLDTLGRIKYRIRGFFVPDSLTIFHISLTIQIFLASPENADRPRRVL